MYCGHEVRVFRILLSGHLLHYILTLGLGFNMIANLEVGYKFTPVIH